VGQAVQVQGARPAWLVAWQRRGGQWEPAQGQSARGRQGPVLPPARAARAPRARRSGAEWAIFTSAVPEPEQRLWWRKWEWEWKVKLQREREQGGREVRRLCVCDVAS
jgi:hypothetical protein